MSIQNKFREIFGISQNPTPLVQLHPELFTAVKQIADENGRSINEVTNEPRSQRTARPPASSEQPANLAAAHAPRTRNHGVNLAGTVQSTNRTAPLHFDQHGQISREKHLVQI